jgi:hypothetical protein
MTFIFLLSVPFLKVEAPFYLPAISAAGAVALPKPNTVSSDSLSSFAAT